VAAGQGLAILVAVAVAVVVAAGIGVERRAGMRAREVSSGSRHNDCSSCNRNDDVCVAVNDLGVVVCVASAARVTKMKQGSVQHSWGQLQGAKHCVAAGLSAAT
jgi:hypothetical protein